VFFFWGGCVFVGFVVVQFFFGLYPGGRGGGQAMGHWPRVINGCGFCCVLDTGAGSLSGRPSGRVGASAWNNLDGFWCGFAGLLRVEGHVELGV